MVGLDCHGPDWTAMARTDCHGPDWTAMARTGLPWTGLDCHGPDWTAMAQTGLPWSGLDCHDPDWIGLDAACFTLNMSHSMHSHHHTNPHTACTAPHGRSAIFRVRAGFRLAFTLP
jgi:hypothetical protein